MDTLHNVPVKTTIKTLLTVEALSFAACMRMIVTSPCGCCAAAEIPLPVFAQLPYDTQLSLCGGLFNAALSRMDERHTPQGRHVTALSAMNSAFNIARLWAAHVDAWRKDRGLSTDYPLL